MRGRGLGLRQHILDRVVATPGRVWTPVDFVDVAARAAIDKALQRLVTGGEIRRVARGLYDRPRINRLTGELTVPDYLAVIRAIGRRDQVRVVVDGMTAANELGLTTAVPARVIVLTDARLRPIRLGRQQITFQQAAPSRLYWANRPAMRVVQSLYWLHDLLPTDRDEIVARLAVVLADPDHGSAIRDDLRAGLSKLPTWMQTTVRPLISDTILFGAVKRAGKQDPGGVPNRRMRGRSTTAAAGTRNRVLGRKAFAAITAVEGLKLSAAGKKRLRAMIAKGLSPEECRAEVLRAYTDRSRR